MSGPLLSTGAAGWKSWSTRPHGAADSDCFSDDSRDSSFDSECCYRASRIVVVGERTMGAGAALSSSMLIAVC